MKEKKLIQDRKAFNFYRSYYDVAAQLDDANRLQFYDAVMRYQFFKEEVELSGMAKFAFISQKHSIAAQVDGYENSGLMNTSKGGSKGASKAPQKGAFKGGSKGACQQEKDDNIEIKYILDNVSSLFKSEYINKKVEDTLGKLLLKYDKDIIVKSIKWAKNDSFWNSNFLSINKLIQTNKEGVKFIDLFISKSGLNSTQTKPAKFEIPVNPYL